MSINFSLLFAAIHVSNRIWWLLPLVTIPALILGLVPFLRLNKKRRASSKHLIPFIIHMTLLLVLTAIVAGITWVTTFTESEGNVVMFLVDMSDSNAPTKEEMNDYIHKVMEAAEIADKRSDRSENEKTKFGLMVFGGSGDVNSGIISNKDGELSIKPGYLDINTEDFLADYVKGEEEAPRQESNIKLAIEMARNVLINKEYKQNKKKIVLLSDGRETDGNAYNAAATLAEDRISLDCAHFDFVNNPNGKIYKEIQVISLETNGTVKLGEEVKVNVILNSTYHITDAKITLKDVAGTELESINSVVVPKGQSSHTLTFTPRRYTVSDDDYETNAELKGQEAVSKTGVQAISVEVTTRDDLLPLNNTFSSWYTFETQGEILIVYGDSDQLSQIKEAGILMMDKNYDGTLSSSRGIIKANDGSAYSVTAVSATAFPDTLEKMLVYDEIILMNVDFSKLGKDSTAGVSPDQIAQNIKRYVQEVGRGLLFTAGDNIYDYKNSYYCKDCDESFAKEELQPGQLCPVCGTMVNNEGSFVESPLNEILPVDLKVDEEKETVAMVIVVDLSSSMKELVANSGVICKICNTAYDSKPAGDFCEVCDKKTAFSSPTRYHVVLESVKKVILESKFEPTDYVGVVVFDQDYHVALEIQEIGDEENRKTIVEQMEYEFEHYYYAHYIDNATGEESDIRINFANDGQPGLGNKYVDKVGNEEPKYSLPTSNYQDGGQDKATGDFIKSRGTSYKWPVQEASAMLARAANITSIEIKQVIFMSDGAPNDKGSGYEGIVERMAKGGTVTSTIAIGISQSDAAGIAELEKISVAGKGKLFLVQSAKDLEEDLTEITDSIQGKLLNEDITAKPMRDSLNSIVHEGVKDYDQVHGYYGTTIKDGAERVIYVDNLRPLYSEWEFGLGKVCAFMTNLGNADWTGEMFDDTDEISNVRLIQNILLSPIHKRIDSTGLDYTVIRDDDSIEITIKTFQDLALKDSVGINSDGETVKYKEIIRALVYKFNPDKKIWEEYTNSNATAIADSRYRVEVPTNSIEETYVIVLNLTKVEVGYTSSGHEAYTIVNYSRNYDDAIRDTTALAVVGKTLQEYDVLKGDQLAGKDLLNGLVTSDTEGLLGSDSYDIADSFMKKDTDEKEVTEEKDIDIYLVILALILFILDIIFRSFVIKKRQKKQKEMTEEERLESMRGR